MLGWLRFISQLTLLVSAGAFAPTALANTMSTATPNQSKYILYVGTYAKGVYAFRYDTADSSLQPLSQVGDVVNPSWIGTDPQQKHLFAVSELDGDNQGAVVSFSIDRASGRLKLINRRSSEGLAPCHLAVDRTGKMLVTANYTSGHVTSYPLAEDGTIGEHASLMNETGTGPNKERQEGPHAHETVISADNKFLYVPDLGLDQIRVYKIDPASARLTPADPPHASEAPGMGPRHMAFSPNEKFAYVINELKPAVSVFSHDAKTGKLQSIQTISSVADNQSGEISPAEILTDKTGKFVYASNRGPGTIAVFSVDQTTGKLTRIQIAETGLVETRGVEFDPTGNTLLVGDQKADKFVTLQVDHNTGKLKLTGKSYQVPSPVAFVFVPASE